MYHEFALLGVKTNLREKKIEVLFNQDVRENKELKIELFERSSKTPVIFDYELLDEKIIITLRDWAIVNSKYILGIQGVTSITEEKLISNIKKVISFESGIVSRVIIKSPSDFEEVEALLIKLDEITTNELNPTTTESVDGIHGNDEKVGSYYVEVSTDNAFIDKQIETMFHKEQIKLSLDKPGQYYLRARVQLELENGDITYGEWSETTTFIYKYIELDNGNIIDENPNHVPDIDNDLDPVVDLEELELVVAPEQGVTGESFIFEFNKDLEDLILGDIYVIRKDVK